MEAGRYLARSSLDSIALSLLECWRRFLLEVIRRESSRNRFGIDDSSVSDEEGLSDFIDITENLSADMLLDHSDHELASALRLILELDHLLNAGLEEDEHHIVLDAFSLSMMRLAVIMRRRGHRCTLPKVRLR